MRRLIIIIIFFCALKTFAQNIGGEIKLTDKSTTYKSTMASVIKQKIVYKRAKDKELNNAPIEIDTPQIRNQALQRPSCMYTSSHH